MTAPTPEPRRHRASLAVTLSAAALVLVPALFWHQTWFGRPLNDAEMTRFFDDTAHPRHIQHALTQLAERVRAGDVGAARWYPRLAAAARHPAVEIRVLAAWVMGTDGRSPVLHEALLSLLRDPEPLVRRNAALALVRFGDARGRGELLEVLRPYAVAAPYAGAVALRVAVDEDLRRGAVIARIRNAAGKEVDVAAPVAGRVARFTVREGAHVDAGAALADLSPDPDEVWEALRGLYLVGRPPDLPAVEGTAAQPGLPERVRLQARLTAQAIRTRPEPNPNR